MTTKKTAANINTNSNRLTVNVVVNTGRRTAKKDSAHAETKTDEGTTKPANVNVFAPTPSPRIPDSWAAYVRQKRDEANAAIPAVVPGGIPNLPRQASSPPQFQTNPLFEQEPPAGVAEPPEQPTPPTAPPREMGETPFFIPEPEYFKKYKAAEAAPMSPAPSGADARARDEPEGSSPKPMREMPEGDVEYSKLRGLGLQPIRDIHGILTIYNMATMRRVLANGPTGKRIIREAEAMAVKESIL